MAKLMDCARLGQRSGTSQSNMAAAEMCAKQTKKQGKSRTWTETELKYFAIVLTDEKYEYGHKLDSLALKKSANKSVFEDVKKACFPQMNTSFLKKIQCHCCTQNPLEQTNFFLT